MQYTSDHQEADKNFLMGAAYGKDFERARILDLAKSAGSLSDLIKELS